MARIFQEQDDDRLARRLSAVAAGDLTHRQITELINGDLALVKGLPKATRQGIAALVDDSVRGELEKMVGPTDDFLPVAYLDLSRAAANAVARVVDTKRRAIGTGFMVSPRLFMTNNHVTDTAAVAADRLLQFGYELAADGTPMEPTEFALDPASFFWTSPNDILDVTVVAVGKKISGTRPLGGFGWCALSSARDKHAEGDFVTIIQHPEGDFKQIALRGNAVIGRGKAGNTLHYGADTLGGSSGSPVFNDQFDLVALHHAGGPRNDLVLESDEAVPKDSNEGIRISALVKALQERHDELPPAIRVILAEALNPPTAGPSLEGALGADGASSLTVSDRSIATSLGGGAMGGVAVGSIATDMNLPIRVIVGHAGALSAVVPPAPVVISPSGTAIAQTAAVLPSGARPGVGEFERNQEPSRDYENRRGYDPDFLAQPVPVPIIAKTVLKHCAVPAGGEVTSAGLLLAYHHFSVVVRADRQMPLFTMVNIDGRKARGINRKTGEVEASETWYVDPRLGAEQQLAQRLFDRQRPRHFDRGHLVRRLDPAWGSPAMAKRSADDTFHFTNCCPQISDFNQHLWQSIENFALDNATDEKKRITVITGPVFTPSDPRYRGTAIPRAFWKLVIRIDKAKLAVTAFLADQGEALDAALAAEGPEAFTELGKVAVFQTTVAAIEKRSSLKFGSLRDNDTAGAGLEAMHPIASLDQAQWSVTDDDASAAGR